MARHPIVIAAFILGAFAIAGTTLVAVTHAFTKERIAFNERQTLLKSLNALVPEQSVDNDMVSDTLVVSHPELLGSPETTVYRGRKLDQPVAAVLTSIVPDGYSGPIKLLVAVHYNGTLGGVRVISHKETPGLGDKIEESRSDWILGFAGKSLADPTEAQWKVKRDGGIFDQFTGATITPRSIVKAVKNTLLYVREHRDALYDRNPTQQATLGQR
ncbi:MAG: electron transport complex subunit RsxG [Gammaproteobacteria bacterium]|nr:electron transport complex subunit RsxG [Gammaproteobacteria bacterium]